MPPFSTIRWHGRTPQDCRRNAAIRNTSASTGFRLASRRNPRHFLERDNAGSHTQIATCGYRTYTAFTRSCPQACREVRQFLSASQSLPALEISERVPIPPRKWLAYAVQRHPLNGRRPENPRVFRCRVPNVPLRLVRSQCSAGRMVVEVGPGSSEPRTDCCSPAAQRAITERQWSAMATGIPGGEHRSLPGRGVPLLIGRRTPCSQQA